MATIVVEDGSGLTNSNSYLSEADLSTYAADRGVTLAGTPAVLLIQGMDWIESHNFQGYKYTEDQALPWPRGSVYIDGYSISETYIPLLLSDALAEVCISIDGGFNPLSNVPRETTKEKVGDIEVEYKEGGSITEQPTAAENKLTKLLDNPGFGAVVKRG